MESFDFLNEFDPFEVAGGVQQRIEDSPNDETRMALFEWGMEMLEPIADALTESDAQYLVNCITAYIQPATLPSEPQRIITFDNISVIGSFDDFSYIELGSKNNQRPPISTICASLIGVTLLPYGDHLQAGDVLHVPVLRVRQRTRLV